VKTINKFIIQWILIISNVPLFFSVAPKFTVQPQNPTEAIEGYPVMLHCAAEGDPKPTIQWDKDSRMNNLDNPRFELLSNGSLYIKEVYLSDEGKYGCTAGNSGGLKREEVQLNVKGTYVATYNFLN